MKIQRLKNEFVDGFHWSLELYWNISVIISGRSFKKIRNKIGPRIDPCRTQILILLGSEVVPEKSTTISLTNK